MTPCIIWITGLSGAGKTTIATALADRLRHDGPVVLLDGDAVRALLQDSDIGHDRVSRLRNAYRMARLARLLAEQGVLVIVATMSLFKEIYHWNRQMPGCYFEVYLDVEQTVLTTRDPKGIYKAYFDGRIANVAGFDLAIDLPPEPHMRISNNGGTNDIPGIIEQIREQWQTYLGTQL